MIEVGGFEFINLAPLVERAREHPARRLCVAGAGDRDVVETAAAALEAGLIEPILVGDREVIEPLLGDLEVSLSAVEILHHPDAREAAQTAAQLVGRGDASILMKGMVSSGAFLRAVLDERSGLRTGRVLSHVGIFDLPRYDRLLCMTDGGINISPDFETRVQIVQNAIELGGKVFGREPRVALLAAVEVVQSSMPVTLEWAALTQMTQRGQIKGASVDGPLALDVAIDPASARHKGLHGPVAGRADILVVPDIEAGNLLGKAMTYLGGAVMAGVVVGARAPVILNSRADTPHAKLASIVAALALT